MPQQIETEEEFMKRFRESAPQTAPEAPAPEEAAAQPEAPASDDGLANATWKATVGSVAKGIKKFSGAGAIQEKMGQEGGLAAAIGLPQVSLEDSELKAIGKRALSAPVNLVGGAVSMGAGLLDAFGDPKAAAKGISTLATGYWENYMNQLGYGKGEETPEIKAFKEFSDKHMGGLGKEVSWDEFKQNVSEMAQRDPFEFAMAATPVVGAGVGAGAKVAGTAARVGGEVVAGAARNVGVDAIRASVAAENAGRMGLAGALETAGGALQKAAPAISRGGAAAGEALDKFGKTAMAAGMAAPAKVGEAAMGLPATALGKGMQLAGRAAEYVPGLRSVGSATARYGERLMAHPIIAPAMVAGDLVVGAAKAPFQAFQKAAGVTSGMGSEVVGQFMQGASKEMKLGRAEGEQFAEGGGSGVGAARAQAEELYAAGKKRETEAYQEMKNDMTPVAPESVDSLLASVNAKLKNTGFAIDEYGNVLDTGAAATPYQTTAKLGGAASQKAINEAVVMFQRAVTDPAATVGSIAEAYGALKKILSPDKAPDAAPIIGAIKKAIHEMQGELGKIGAVDREFGAIEDVLKATKQFGESSDSAAASAMKFISQLNSRTPGTAVKAREVANALNDMYRKYVGREGFDFEGYAKGLKASEWARSKVASSVTGGVGLASYALSNPAIAAFSVSILAATSPRVMSYVAQTLGLPLRVVKSVADQFGAKVGNAMDAVATAMTQERGFGGRGGQVAEAPAAPAPVKPMAEQLAEQLDDAPVQKAESGPVDTTDYSPKQEFAKTDVPADIGPKTRPTRVENLTETERVRREVARANQKAASKAKAKEFRKKEAEEKAASDAKWKEVEAIKAKTEAQRIKNKSASEKKAWLKENPLRVEEVSGGVREPEPVQLMGPGKPEEVTFPATKSMKKPQAQKDATAPKPSGSIFPEDKGYRPVEVVKTSFRKPTAEEAAKYREVLDSQGLSRSEIESAVKEYRVKDVPTKSPKKSIAKQAAPAKMTRAQLEEQIRQREAVLRTTKDNKVQVSVQETLEKLRKQLKSMK